MLKHIPRMAVDILVVLSAPLDYNAHLDLSADKMNADLWRDSSHLSFRDESSVTISLLQLNSIVSIKKKSSFHL